MWPRTKVTQIARLSHPLSARRVAVHANDIQLHPGHAGLGEAADPAREPPAAGESLREAEAGDQRGEESGRGGANRKSVTWAMKFAYFNIIN